MLGWVLRVDWILEGVRVVVEDVGVVSFWKE